MGKILVISIVFFMLGMINPSLLLANSISDHLSESLGIKQIFQVRGNIVDETGEPLIGVSILLEGTSTGTVSDIDGNFMMQLPSSGVLQITYVGYKTQRISVNQSNDNLKIVMEPEVSTLDEVVAIGYGTTRKRDLTGAVSSVKTSDIVQIPTSNAMDAIQGRVAGMDITRSSGSAGSGVNITIRGTKTLGYTDIYGNKTRNTEPLFIIDGVQGGSYADLNPNDIESIDVLKDASSTAIYGSLGANGVVIITTKRGKENKVSLKYDGYYGVNGFVDYPTPRIGESYLDVRREAYRAVGQWESQADDFKIFSNEEWNAIQNNQWVNWIDELVRQGRQQSHNVTVSSNNDKLSSYLSLGYYNEEGIFKKDDFTRYTLRVNLDYEVRKWLNIGVNSQLTYFNQNRVPSNMLIQAMTYIPLGTPYDQNGEINLFPVSGDAQRLSPLANYASDNKAIDNTIALRSFNTAYLILRPIEQLSWRSNLSTSVNSHRRGIYNGQYSTNQYGGSYINQAQVNKDLFRNYTWDNIITYSENIGNHYLEATGISTWIKNMDESYSSSGNNQLLDSYLFYSRCYRSCQPVDLFKLHTIPDIWSGNASFVQLSG